MGRTRELTLVAAKRPQLRKRAKRDWSKAKAAKFLNVLVETCNVSEACRESGVSVTVAYRRRKMDAGFRSAWREAIGIAYQRLELVLLDRAFNGTPKVITRRDGSEERMLEYSNQLGLTLAIIYLTQQPSDPTNQGGDRPALQRAIEGMLMEELSDGLEGPLYPSHARLIARRAIELFNVEIEALKAAAD